jgi:hypothetical protein
MTESIGEKAQGMHAYSTLGTPRFKTAKPIDKIDKNMRCRYRSGDEILLYIIKLYHPDISPEMREFSS